MPSRTSSGIIVVGVLAALSFWMNRSAVEEESSTIEGLDTQLNYALREFEARYYDEQGRLAGEIKAPLLTNDAETGIGRIAQPRFKVMHQGNLWTILSESATLTPDRENVLFTGSVNMSGLEPGTRREVRIQALEVTLEIDPRVVRSNDEVTINEGQNFLTATGFRLDMISNQFQLFSDVVGRYAVE